MEKNSNKKKVSASTDCTSAISRIQLGNASVVVKRIEDSKKNPNRNEGYYTLVQSNSYTEIHTNAESLKRNSSFVLNSKF